MHRVSSLLSKPRIPLFVTTSAMAGLALAAFLPAHTKAEDSPLATIQGFVRDQATQAPIPNAWVCYAELLDKDGDGVHRAVHAFTDASGHYSLTMPSDEYEWMACSSAPGYANANAMSVAVAANQNFLLHAAPGSIQFWGQLQGVESGLRTGTPVYSDLDESSAVSVTDDLGRFPYVIEQNVIVPLTIISNALGVHRYEIEIDSSVPVTNPLPVQVATALPTMPVLTDVTVASSGAGAPAGTMLSMVGVDSSGEIVFEATETMDSSQVHTNQFDIPSGLDLHILATNDFGWGSTQVATPHSAPIPLSINDLGTGSITARIIPQTGMPDPGTLILEVQASGQGVELFAPLREAPVVPGAAIYWDLLPAGSYRLRHTSTRFDRLVDEIQLSPGEAENHSYIAHKIPESTQIFGVGTGTLLGKIQVPQPANTTINVYLTDPLDGRIEGEATADASGGYSFYQVPAGDWYLHADATHDNGMEYRLLEGTIRVSIENGKTLDLPSLDLTPSIGLAFRAYGHDYVDDSDGGELTLLPLDTYTVSLHDSQGVVSSKNANGFQLLAFGSVPASVTKVVVDGQPLGSKVITIDLSGVDPLSHFQIYDVVVN